MQQCGRLLRAHLRRRGVVHAARGFFGGLDRPLPDDILSSVEQDAAPPAPAPAALRTDTPPIRNLVEDCATSEHVCDVFSEQRQRLQPADLVTLLSKIVALECRRKPVAGDPACEMWPSTEFCVTELCGLQGRMSVMRLDQRVADMYSDVISRAALFSATHLLYLQRIGAYIRGYHNKMLRAHSEAFLSSCAWSLDTDDLCRCVVVLAQASDNVPFVKQIGHVAVTKLPELAASQRVLLLRVLSSARHGSALFLQGAARHALNRNLFAGPDVVRVLACYAQRPSACSGAVFESLLERSVGVDLSELDPQDLCDLIWATCKYSNQGAATLQRCESVLLEHCASIPPRSVSMLLWAMAESGHGSPALLGALEAAATACAASMSPSQVAVCVHSLSQLKPAGSSAGFAGHVEADVIANIVHFNGLDLAMLAEGFARLGAGSATLHQCIQECALKYSADLPADCLSKLLWSYGVLGGRESFFAALQFPLLQRVNQFPAHELCRALWAYAVARFFDVSFWRNCIALLDAQDVRGNDRCAPLFPALSEAAAVRKELLTPETLRLLNHTRGAFAAEERAAHCAAAAGRLEAVLSAGGVRASCGVDFSGFLLDASFEKEGLRHAVLVYGRAATCGSTLRPAGGMVLKARFLRRHGFKVLHVLRDPFMSMGDRESLELLTKQM